MNLEQLLSIPIEAMKYLASAVLKPGDTIHWQVP
ncbi:hypothetical protein PBI_STANNES_65 [Mycobacterium phage StAnnes]|nr:hypothetical protein PBI_STANNES_65 [Mycobacterium phage StAnnes]